MSSKGKRNGRDLHTHNKPPIFNLCLYVLQQVGPRKKRNDTELLETILLEVSISPSHHKCLFSQDHTIRTPR